MKRIILGALNAPLLILCVAVGLALQSSLFYSYPFLYLQPDVVLLAVIWCSLRRSFTEGGILTLIFGNLAEIHSGAPQGLFLISYMAVYLSMRALARFFVIADQYALVAWTLGMSVFWKLCNLFVLYLMNLASHQWRHTLVLLAPGAVMNGILAVWAYRWLTRLDWATFKSERARQSEGEDLQLEAEGF